MNLKRKRINDGVLPISKLTKKDTFKCPAIGSSNVKQSFEFDATNVCSDDQKTGEAENSGNFETFEGDATVNSDQYDDSQSIKSTKICPIVGCDREIRHYSANKARHIKEFHGQIYNGNWVLKRVKCGECEKKNISKTAKRKESLILHFNKDHPNEKLNIITVYIPTGPPKYKE